MLRKIAFDAPAPDPHIAGLVQAGVFDPSLYKVIFTAGGPGSGKSYVIETMPFAKLGMRVVDQDVLFQMLAKRESLPLRMENYTPEQVALKDKIRDRAFQLALDTRDERNTSVLKLCLTGKLGIVVDGTGRDYEFVVKQRKTLTDYGYESFMLLVNTRLDVAQARNRARQRSLPPELVQRFWGSVQANRERFRALFSGGPGSGGASNFHELDNSEDADHEMSRAAFSEAQAVIRGWASRPVRAPAAVQWIREELAKRGDTHKRLLVELADPPEPHVDPSRGEGPGMGHNNPPSEHLF